MRAANFRALCAMAVIGTAVLSAGPAAGDRLLQQVVPTAVPTNAAILPTASPSATPSAAPSAAPTAAASVPPPVTTGGPFGALGPNDINGTMAIGGNALAPNTAPALAVANVTERLASLLPCVGFVPHYHPGASEVLTVFGGAIQACVYLNGVNACRTLKPGQAILIPQGHIHWFWNYRTAPAYALANLNSASPGFFAYGNLAEFPEYVSGFFPVAANVTEALIASQVATSTPPATFLNLTRTSCQP